MKQFLEKAVMLILILAMILLVLQTSTIIIELPESESKKMAIVVLIPIIGAIVTGLLLELFKFWLQRNTDEKNRNSLIISEVTQKAVSISMQLYTKNNLAMVKDKKKYQDDLQTIFKHVASSGNAECIACLEPLVECLNSVEDIIDDEKIKNALKDTIISLRKSLGYTNTQKSNDVIKLMLM